MKRITALLLLAAMVLTLAACGSKTVTIDLDAVYKTAETKLPTMLPLDTTGQLNFMGVKAEDCEKSIVAICGDGSLRADEIWLIKAKDKDALARIQKLADTRLKAKAEETESYVPDQYTVVKAAVTVTRDLYFAMIVSPEAEAIKAAFEAAAK